jgi:diazepam-binding inhibitor (GABA receptor modulating acyl-CoA-binding protein)
MKFKEAAERVKMLNGRPDDKTLLKLYSLYKQATVGDCKKSEPSYFLMKDKEWYKWDAWNRLKGKSKQDAEKEYIRLVERLIEKDV